MRGIILIYIVPLIVCMLLLLFFVLYRSKGIKNAKYIFSMSFCILLTSFFSLSFLLPTYPSKELKKQNEIADIIQNQYDHVMKPIEIDFREGRISREKLKEITKQSKKAYLKERYEKTNKIKDDYADRVFKIICLFNIILIITGFCFSSEPIKVSIILSCSLLLIYNAVYTWLLRG